ncbi:MAG TPA: dTDP-4-dehydrorhamnose reductase [Blastocatellia bacterium]|nr:dTDP-4-dehydrorhamnose reductase [Blastocatellia bacterium]
MRRILLLGKDGQLGWELQRSLAPLGEVVALGRSGATASGAPSGSRYGDESLCGDLTQPAELEDTVLRLEPHFIVNAAAYTAVDKAESEPELARAVNAEGPGVLAEIGGKTGAWIIHFSTDYVFDGSGVNPWHEEDRPAPLSVYGQTKLEGENRIRSSGCRHLIFRTSWVYAARGANFARTILRLAVERDRLNVVDDQVGVPTGADLLADIAAHALCKVESRADLGGTYHAAASGETSWFGYARFLIESARTRGWAIKVPTERICPVASSAFPSTARRPLNSRLDCSKLERAFGLRMPEWRFGVDRLIDEMRPA